MTIFITKTRSNQILQEVGESLAAHHARVVFVAPPLRPVTSLLLLTSLRLETFFNPLKKYHYTLLW
jgi:hypothetical protein